MELPKGVAGGRVNSVGGHLRMLISKVNIGLVINLVLPDSN